MSELTLGFLWKVRCWLLAEGAWLLAEGAWLRAEADKLQAVAAELDKLQAVAAELQVEGDKLWAEGDKLQAVAAKLWTDGILEVHGNIVVEWQGIEGKRDYRCRLETGEVFEPVA